jgi:hypothetical protein
VRDGESGCDRHAGLGLLVLVCWVKRGRAGGWLAVLGWRLVSVVPAEEIVDRRHVLVSLFPERHVRGLLEDDLLCAADAVH